MVRRVKPKKLGKNPKAVPAVHFKYLTKSYGTEPLAPQSESLAYTSEINMTI